MKFDNSRSFAEKLDIKDPLGHFREQFHIPEKRGTQVIYFCGNSLGLQPKNVREELETELNSWKTLAVEGHFSGPRPWANYHEVTKGSLMRLTGAGELEVVSMNNLTSNLHLMLASFYQPAGKRVKILIEGGAFPSDHYAAESHMKRMGIDPAKHLVTLKPQAGNCLTIEEIEQEINKLGDELALILFPGVQYFTGQLFDMNRIASAAHSVGAYAGLDLAHAIGNVPLSLHEDEIDFATWCSYKYLNSGPGGVSGVFVHERHSQDPNFPKLTGWWGHDRKTRFQMDNKFIPNPGVDSWMLSNVNILSTAAHLAALKIFDETDMNQLRKKSLLLTGFLEFLIQSDSSLSSSIKIITPADPQQRGCQLSMKIDHQGRQIFERLTDAGVVPDWREPNVIRIAPVPLYNSFTEVWEFYEILKNLIENR